MVVAMLAARFAPSSRGLKRAEKRSSTADYDTADAARRAWSNRYSSTTTNHRPAATADYQNLNDTDTILQSSSSLQRVASGLSHNAGGKHGAHVRLGGSHSATATAASAHPVATAGHRRKPFRAMACLTSFASDLDVISDWFFYNDTLQTNREYRREYAKLQANNFKRSDDANAEFDFITRDSAPYLVPPILMNLLLASCIVGSILYTILATDGRIATPILRRLGIDKLSMGLVLLLCVVLEDIPQVVLAFLVEDYYEEDFTLSSFAVLNVTCSFYDTLIKIAEAYDERHDVVETGVWCKHSIAGPHGEHTITAVVVLPRPLQQPPQQQPPAFLPKSASDGGPLPLPSSSSHPQPQRLSSMPTLASTSGHQSTTAFGTGDPTPIPSLRFLTASLDGTIRLWDSDDPATSAIVAGHRERKTTCIRTFKGHTTGITCLERVVLENYSNNNNNNTSSSGSTLFLSGSQNGITKLWDANTGVCMRDFHSPGNAVASIAVVEAGCIFVTGYQDSSVRLWNQRTGVCLCVFRAHVKTVGCLTAIDGRSFVSGSDDQTLRLWNCSAAMRRFSETTSNANSALLPPTTPVSSDEDGEEEEEQRQQDANYINHWAITPVPSDEKMMARCTAEQPLMEELACAMVYQGHRDVITCVACLESGTVFCSGSLDRTARLWSVESEGCLRVFSHDSGLTSVAAIDEVTLLTGSKDSNIMVWDAWKGESLRTFQGHTDEITGLSVADDDSTFVSCSVDRTIKLWVLTTLPTDKPSETLDEVLDMSDGCCRGFDPS